jgi:hypothetical protein
MGVSHLRVAPFLTRHNHRRFPHFHPWSISSQAQRDTVPLVSARRCILVLRVCEMASIPSMTATSSARPTRSLPGRSRTGTSNDVDDIAFSSGMATPVTQSNSVATPSTPRPIHPFFKTATIKASSTMTSIDNAVNTTTTGRALISPEGSRKRSRTTTHTRASLDELPSASIQVSSSMALPPGPSGSRKGKGKALPPKLEKRVLPARIRRAAGGGADGIRDLEEMVVDWLERWGES